MLKKKKAATKKAASKKKTASKPTYLRVIQIRYTKKRVKDGAPVGKRITGARQVYELFSDMQDETKEKLIVICLDIKLKILCFEVVAIGSLHSVAARPFEVVRSAILVNAFGIVIVHNHPSGEVMPGFEDKHFTKNVKKLADLGGLVVHDHVIIGNGSYYSFTETGLMAKL